MSTINPEFIQRIKDASNIQEVISQYMDLKKAGVNYKGCCPFHGEQTPSFVVSPTKSIYKCFGCDKAGDVISFVQEHEQLSFTETLKLLAKRANIDMPELDMTVEERTRMHERESLLATNASAWSTYRNNLMNSPSAISYVQKRGYTQEVINEFGVGFAEVDNQLCATLSPTQKPHARKLSLIKKGDRGEYDTFRNRIMYAFHDLSGNVIGFTGRHLDWKKGDNFGKWINSDESNLFHKERVVFGLFQAKKHIVRFDKAYVVEGQGDVISLKQSKIENTVAGSGTAFSTHQAKQILRFSKNITLIYDGDAAGAKATLAAMPVLLSEGANMRIISLPAGEDPDSFAQTVSADQLAIKLSNMEVDFVTYLYSLRQGDLKDVYKKNEALNEVGALIALVHDEALKNSFIKTACLLFKVGSSDFAPKCKPAKEVPKFDTWKEGFYGIEEAKKLLKHQQPVHLTFHEQTFLNAYGSDACVFAKNPIQQHFIQEFHAAFSKCRVNEKTANLIIDENANESENLLTVKELFRHGVEIEIEVDFEEVKYIRGFVDYYVSIYNIFISSTNCTENQKAKYIKNCSEIISCANATVRTVSLKTWAKQLEIAQTNLKALIQPLLNLKKDKATLESQRLNEASDLLEFDPEKVPSYVTEDPNMQAIYQRDRFYPLVKKTKTSQMPVAYMFRNDKGGGHTCISDFWMEPLLHITHKDSLLNKRVIQLNHMHLPPTFVEWQSSFMANLGKLNEKFIEEGSYNFDGSMIQWKAIWRNMSYKFTTCTELRTFGQQPEEFWAWTNAIMHEVDGEVKIEYTNPMGVVTHKEHNYYSPAFSEIFAHQRRDSDIYEQDRHFIYKEVSTNERLDFKRWAALTDEVYKVNDNGKWAVLFNILACFRDYIYSQKKFFTTLFFIGPAGSGKTELARSMRSLFVSPDAPAFNLNSGTDAAFFMVLERLSNVICIMEEYNDANISQAKFQGLKAAIFDGEGKIKVKDMNTKTLDTSKINGIPLPLGQEAPQQDDGALAMRCIMCDVPYKERGEFTTHETEIFDRLKMHEKAGLCNVLVEILEIRKAVKSNFMQTFNEEVKAIKAVVSSSVTNTEGLTRVINSIALVTSICNIVETKTSLKLPFTHAEFMQIATDKVFKQMEKISTSNKLSNFFNTITYLLNQGSIKIGKELKVSTCKDGKIKVKATGNTTKEVTLPDLDTKVLFLSMAGVYPLYTRSVKDALSRSSLEAYFASNSAYLGLSKSTNFVWYDEKSIPKEQIDANNVKTYLVDKRMEKKSQNTSAYVFDYDLLKELMDIDFERVDETLETTSNEHVPDTPLPF